MKEHWMKKSWEFQNVYRKGIKKAGKRLILYVWKHEGDKERFGITVTKKVGQAVIRNKIKRKLREIIRNNREIWYGGRSVVVVAKKEVVQSSFHEIETEFLKIFRKIIKSAPL